jgi:hypothetical protein
MENNQKYIEIIKYYLENKDSKKGNSMNEVIIYDGILYLIDYHRSLEFSILTLDYFMGTTINLSIVIKEDINYRKKTLFRCDGDYKSIGFLDLPDYGINDELIDKYF